MGVLLEEMATLDTKFSGDERLAEIRSALAEGTGQLRSATTWLLGQGPLDPNTAGSASVNMLMLTGTVVGGWQMALAALAITNGAASDDRAFADAKLMTARFYGQHIMPRAHGYAMAAMAGADTVMALAEESF